MAQVRQESQVELVKVERVTYKTKDLLGVFSWLERESATHIGDETHIITNAELKDIYVNGKSLLKSGLK